MATNVIGKNNIDNLVIFSLARYKGFNKGGTIALDKQTGEVVWESLLDNYTGAVLPPRGRWMCCAGFPWAFGLPSR